MTQLDTPPPAVDAPKTLTGAHAQLAELVMFSGIPVVTTQMAV